MRPTSFILAPLVLASPALAEDMAYTVDGDAFTGYWAKAEDPAGVVLIVHDWDGLTDYERQRADMLAEMGYDAFAVDIFGDDTPTETVDHRRAAMGALFEDRERMRMLLRTGADMALSRSEAEQMIVMGYCFGGAATLEMARNDGLDAVQGYATFHGGLSTPEGQVYDGDEAPLLILHGGADSSITLDDVATLGTELEAAGTTYRIEIYSGAPHAFTVFDGDRYDERADMASWSAFTAFLEDRLGD